MVRYLIAASLVLNALSASADCTERAGVRFGFDPDLLRAIGEQESLNRIDAVGPLLSDGNRAVGKMGINTIHLPELSQYGVTIEHLFTECGSVFVGAWILGRYHKLAGALWTAVGFYNTGPYSKNKDAQQRYIAAVRRRYDSIKRGGSQRVLATQTPAHQGAVGTMQGWGTP